MEDLNVRQATDALVSAIRQTEAYREYAEKKEAVMADEGYSALLRRYVSAQTALQMAALAGAEPKEEDTAAFESLSALLYANPDVTDYLLAQMKVQRLAADVIERLTREADIQLPVPD